LAGVRARGASKKFGTPFISATAEASNFKFGIILCNGKDVHRCKLGDDCVILGTKFAAERSKDVHFTGTHSF